MAQSNQMLRELCDQLQQTIVVDDPELADQRMTQAQALVRRMMQEALKGDQRMLANVLKLAEKLDELQEKEAKRQQQDKTPAHEWEIFFRFVARWMPFIEAEIEKRKEEAPEYWSFDWCIASESATPWYADLYEDEPVKR